MAIPPPPRLSKSVLTAFRTLRALELTQITQQRTKICNLMRLSGDTLDLDLQDKNQWGLGFTYKFSTSSLTQLRALVARAYRYPPTSVREFFGHYDLQLPYRNGHTVISLSETEIQVYIHYNIEIPEEFITALAPEIGYQIINTTVFTPEGDNHKIFYDDIYYNLLQRLAPYVIYQKTPFFAEHNNRNETHYTYVKFPTGLAKIAREASRAGKLCCRVDFF